MHEIITIDTNSYPKLLKSLSAIARPFKSVTLYVDQDVKLLMKLVYEDETCGVVALQSFATTYNEMLMVIYEYLVLYPDRYHNVILHLTDFYHAIAAKVNRVDCIVSLQKMRRDELRTELNNRLVGLDVLNLDTLIAEKKLMLFEHFGEINLLNYSFTYNKEDKIAIKRLTRVFESISCVDGGEYFIINIHNINTLPSAVYYIKKQNGSAYANYPPNFEWYNGTVYELIKDRYIKAINHKGMVND